MRKTISTAMRSTNVSGQDQDEKSLTWKTFRGVYRFVQRTNVVILKFSRKTDFVCI